MFHPTLGSSVESPAATGKELIASLGDPQMAPAPGLPGWWHPLHTARAAQLRLIARPRQVWANIPVAQPQPHRRHEPAGSPQLGGNGSH